MTAARSAMPPICCDHITQGKQTKIRKLLRADTPK
jgi:hypothetical protein